MAHNRRLGFFLLIVFSGILLLYFWEALFRSQLMVERDLSIFFFPNLKLWVEAVKAGEFPLWNPYTLSGQPLFASLQTCILYPPNILLLLLPLGFAYNLTIVLHFFLSGWFIYLLCREIGGSRTAGVLACLSFSLGGFLLSIHNVLNTFQSVTWTPLIFFFFLRALREWSWKYTLLSMITILVQFLGAGIEAFLLTQVFLLFLVFFPQSLLPKDRYLPWKWRLGMVVLIYLLFVGLGAVQILPFWEMTKNSVRYYGFSFQQATRWSLGWSDFLYFFLPDFFYRGLEYYPTDQNYLKSIYLGIIPFIMLFFFFRGQDRRRPWFGIILLVSLLLALGKSTPFYLWLFTIVPGLHTIRYPAKFFFLTNIFLCLLTGLGWDALRDRLKGDLQQKQGALKKGSIILAFFSALILLGLSLFHGPLLSFLNHSFPISYARPWGLNLHNLERFSFFALLTFLFFIFLADRKISIKWAATFLIVLLTLDLFPANWGYYRRMDQKSFFSVSPNLKVVLDDPEKNRIYKDPLMVNIGIHQKNNIDEWVYFLLKECFSFDYPLIHRIHNASGFGLLTYLPYHDLLAVLYETSASPKATDILRVMNVKYLLWREAIQDPSFKLIHTGETYDVLPDVVSDRPPMQVPVNKTIIPHLYENKGVLPRAFLVSRYQVVRDRKQRIVKLEKKDFDVTNVILLEETPLPPPSGDGAIPAGDGVRILSQSLNRIELAASCTGPRLLFLSETYYPGWKVWIDGKRAKIYRADHAFRAVALGPGRHIISFIYRPFSFYFGLAVSALTCILLIGYFIVFKKKSS